ncbi:PqqD family protein [Bradyrhizobium sp. SZCCHNR1083]|uniref:PqqD family protein n=1 Tax=unclassified Bradyrhizobium TaxID=2631580 RepID=UPI00396565AF
MSEIAPQCGEFPARHPSSDWREYAKGILTESGIAMNATAAFVFKRCDGATRTEDIVHSYSDEFAVPLETARADVAYVLKMLRDQSILL